MFHEIIKHIKVNYHFIRDKIQAENIETPFVKSKKLIDGYFHKRLELRKFEESTLKLGLIHIYNSNLRGVLRNKIK
jgi:hypothetical protein